MRPRAKLTILTTVFALMLIITCVNRTIKSSSQRPPIGSVINLEVNRQLKEFNLNLNKPVRITPASVLRDASPAPYKHVTKSLAELDKMDEISKYMVFLNAVPNSGSEILALLLKWLQGWNNFKHVKLRGSKKLLKSIEEEEFVYNTCEIIRDEAVPTSVDRMMYFVNFTRFDRQSPSYINLIRNPADYLISRFHHLMQNDALAHLKTPQNIEKCFLNRDKRCILEDGKEYDLAIPYFCGQHANCRHLNNDWALRQAQQTIEKYYAVLGVLDEVNSTLEVLEYELPYFFKGASKLYYRDLLQPSQKKRHRKIKTSNKFKNLIKLMLHKEYEFYEWAKSRLFRQLKFISAH